MPSYDLIQFTDTVKLMSDRLKEAETLLVQLQIMGDLVKEADFKISQARTAADFITKFLKKEST